MIAAAEPEGPGGLRERRRTLGQAAGIVRSSNAVRKEGSATSSQASPSPFGDPLSHGHRVDFLNDPLEFRPTEEGQN